MFKSKYSLIYQGNNLFFKWNHKKFSTTSNITNPLSDSFGRFHNYLRISLTERCNLRCEYCMPPDGIDLTPPDNLLTLEDNKRLINIFTKLGVNKIRFTGGEPTISKQLIPLISYSKSVSNVNMIGTQKNAFVFKLELFFLYFLNLILFYLYYF